VSVPSRRYRLAAEIFADGLERADDAVLGDVQAAARDRGIAIGAKAASATSSLSAPTGAPAATSGRNRLRSVLEASGFAPADDGDEIRLGNCPFDPIAAGHRDLTCPMNLALLDGVLEGIGETGYAAVAAPVEGSCCVRFVPS
jgi:predicted ArsR family transcriptional regulator